VDFTFAQNLPDRDPLGGLRGFLAGAERQRTWTGGGFTMIWRPNHGQSGTKDFFLQLMFTHEELQFTDITGSGIANRGFLQDDIKLGGLAYLQTITNVFDSSGQHFEPGVWISVPPTTNPLEPPTLVRMGSIPHGTTIELQGTATQTTQPGFAPVSITPFQIGNPAAKVPFPEEQLSQPSSSRTPLDQVIGLKQVMLTDPNSLLQHTASNQTILATTVITVASAPDTISNIPFLGPNARVSSATATFWIERVKSDDSAGPGEFFQLQYSQRVLLDFNGLSWPHVSVATLTATG
jgi:hypothetical protein